MKENTETIKKDNIHTNIQFYLDDIELNISVKNDLSAQDGGLINCGFIQITDGGLDTESIFWDNLRFFLDCGKKEFKKECKKELKQKGYDWKEIYTKIKWILSRAKELKIIVE